MIDPIQREVEWEHSAIERGVRRYRESLLRERKDGSLEPRELAELEPGQEIMRDLVGRSVKALEAAATLARDSLANKGRGREERWWWPILSLDPDKIAVIGARVLLAERHAPGSTGARPLRSVALAIGRGCQVQREFELWRADVSAKSRASRGTDTFVPDYWKLMRELAPELTERAFRKWSKKSGVYNRLDWPREMRLHLGVKVAHVIAESAPEWVTITAPGYVRHGRYRTERVVALTDHARAWIAKRHDYNELRRPWLVPMLVPPRDWTRVQREETSNAAVRVDGPQDDGSLRGSAAHDG